MKTKRILLAEKEPIITAHICRVLEAEGWAVNECDAENINLILKEDRLPDLVVTNADTFRLFQDFFHFLSPNLRYKTKLLIITGMRDVDFLEYVENDFPPNILYKPFTRTQLLSAIEKTLPLGGPSFRST